MINNKPKKNQFMVMKTKEKMKMEQQIWATIHVRKRIEYRMQKKKLKHHIFEPKKIGIEMDHDKLKNMNEKN